MFGQPHSQLFTFFYLLLVVILCVYAHISSSFFTIYLLNLPKISCMLVYKQGVRETHTYQPYNCTSYPQTYPTMKQRCRMVAINA
jgi:hypothetical protein